MVTAHYNMILFGWNTNSSIIHAERLATLPYCRHGWTYNMHSKCQRFYPLIGNGRPNWWLILIDRIVMNVARSYRRSWRRLLASYSVINVEVKKLYTLISSTPQHSETECVLTVGQRRKPNPTLNPITQRIVLRCIWGKQKNWEHSIREKHYWRN